jgi:hypothetical protein
MRYGKVSFWAQELRADVDKVQFLLLLFPGSAIERGPGKTSRKIKGTFFRLDFSAL